MKRSLELRDQRRRLLLSRRDYDRLNALRIKSPALYCMMLVFHQNKEVLSAAMLRYPSLRRLEAENARCF